MSSPTGLITPSDVPSPTPQVAVPAPDARWVNFIGGLDEQGQPVPVTYERLAAATDELPVTQPTPPGVAGLLNTSRQMWGLAWFHYELLCVAAAWSLTAVEAALRSRLGGAASPTFAKLIRRAREQGLLSEASSGSVDAGRELRNGFAHPTRQGAWTPGMAYTVLRASHEVADLFPEPQGDGNAD